MLFLLVCPKQDCRSLERVRSESAARRVFPHQIAITLFNSVLLFFLYRIQLYYESKGVQRVASFAPMPQPNLSLKHPAALPFRSPPFSSFEVGVLRVFRCLLLFTPEVEISCDDFFMSMDLCLSKYREVKRSGLNFMLFLCLPNP